MICNISYMTTDFSSEIMEARRKWHNIFQMLKEKYGQWTNFISSEIILQEWEEMKTFKDERKLRKFVTTRPALKISNRKEMIKERILEHQEREKKKPKTKESTKIWIFTIDILFFSPKNYWNKFHIQVQNRGDGTYKQESRSGLEGSLWNPKKEREKK